MKRTGCRPPIPRIARLLVLAFALAAPAFAARPVARWDVVPDQRVSGTFLAGVCAFHEDGVRVAFSIDGKFVRIANEPRLNPRTGVREYVFPLDTSKLPDGPVTIGARARSGGEKPEEFDLPPLTLYANNGGSLTVADTLWVDSAHGDDAAAGTEKAPLKTIAAAMKRVPVGGTVLLRAGEYSLAGVKGGSDRPYWTTIAAAPGVARDDVQIAKGRPGTQRLRFKGVSLYCDADSSYTAILDGENGNHIVWLDDCKCYNKKGRWAANANVFGNNYVGYVTGGLTTELNNGPGATLIRDHEVRKIASDVWTGSDKLVVNCTASDVDGGSTGAHPDFHQSHAEAPNWVHDVILYNVTGYNCKCQGLFGVRLRDSAFVNVVFERTTVSDFLTQYSDVMENVLFAHVTLINQTWLWRDGYTPVDVRVYNSCMQRMGANAALTPSNGSGADGLLVSNCFFYRSNGAFGQNALSGDPHFADTNASDYALLADSPALANFRPFQCIPTDFRGVPYADEPSGLFTLGGTASNRFTPPADRTWPANPGDAEICLWKDDAFAAGSITIDDNCAYDHDWWLQQARDNDLRLTWFVITDNVEGSNPTAGGTWPGWQRLADAGHAINSHSTCHRGETEENPYSEADWLSYYGDSKAAIDSHVTNNVCTCIAYPGGAGNSVNTNYASRFFIAGRGTTGTPNPPAKINYLQACASSSSDPNPYLTVILGGTVESPAWLNSANYHRGWFVSIVHSVQSNTNTVGALIQAYVSRRPDLWVDTFPAVAKYGQERDTAALSTYAADGDRIVLTLTDAMDDTLFDEPLTLKVRLPAAWTNLVATQKGRIVTSSTVVHDGVSYGLVNAVPDAGAIVLHNLAPPELPEEPDSPDNPDNPDDPDNPDNPDNPDTPDPDLPPGTIGTAADLQTALAAASAGDVVTLGADIELPSNWTALDSAAVLNGAGHTIRCPNGGLPLFETLYGCASNFVLDAADYGASTTYTLANGTVFGSVARALKGGTIQDVTVENLVIATGDSCTVGFLAGQMADGATIAGCTAAASCTLRQKKSNGAGGIVGAIALVDFAPTDGEGAAIAGASLATIADCTNRSPIEVYGTGVFSAGGIVGTANVFNSTYKPEMFILRCVNAANVSVTKSTGTYNCNLGGILGARSFNSSGHGGVLHIIDCANLGDIPASGTGNCRLGGIVGHFYRGDKTVLERCVNRADIGSATLFNGTAVTGNDAGGLFGYVSDLYNLNPISATNCANYGAVTAKCAGGLAGNVTANGGHGYTSLMFHNCANYGTLTPLGEDGMTGEIFARFGSKVANSANRNYGAVNSFFQSDAYYATNTESRIILESLATASDAGYAASAAVNTLNTVAEANAAYVNWKVGRIGPELEPFWDGFVSRTLFKVR